jgi:hypothetical protein
MCVFITESLRNFIMFVVINQSIADTNSKEKTSQLRFTEKRKKKDRRGGVKEKKKKKKTRPQVLKLQLDTEKCFPLLANSHSYELCKQNCKVT